jgi:hypothetical protein
MRKRENIEKILATHEIARYTFIESGCPFKDRKTSPENEDSKAVSIIQNISAVLVGSPKGNFSTSK